MEDGNVKLPIKVTKEVNAKEIRMCLKVSDRFGASIHDEEGNVIGGQNDGYVPGWMPGGGGDYVELDIDLDTGMVTNWKTPNPKDIAKFISNGEGDE
jgi:hypothetical protein